MRACMLIDFFKEEFFGWKFDGWLWALLALLESCFDWVGPRWGWVRRTTPVGWFLFSKISEFPIVHVPKLFPLLHRFQNYFCFCSRTFPSHGRSFFDYNALCSFLCRRLSIGKFKLQVSFSLGSFVSDKNIWNALSISLLYLGASWLQAHKPANLQKNQ